MTARTAVDRRVLLVNPLQVNADDFSLAVAQRKGYPAYPPLGLGYLASALRRAGYEPLLYDSYYDGLERLLAGDGDGVELFFDRFREFLRGRRGLRYIGISVMFAATLKNLARYLAIIGEEAPDATVIAGGTHITCAADSVLALTGVDYAVRFEAESTFPELLRRLDAGEPLAGLSGLTYRQGGALVQEPRTQREMNLDAIADPDWQALRMADYWRIGRFGGAYAIPGCSDQPFACIITSRGCRGHCAFCAVSDIMGGGVRTRSAERVLDEIGYLYEQQGLKFFEILDDDFTFDRARALAILNGIVRRGYDIRWSAKNGLVACSLDAELIAALHASGCRYVQIGVESGNQQILDWLRKPVTVPRLLEVREMFRTYPDIYLAGYFIVGFPEETAAMMRETYDLALKLQLDWSAITMAQPLPGTRMWADMAALGIIDPSTIDMSDLTFFHNTAGNKHHSLAEILEWWHDFNIGVNFVNNPNLNGGDLDRATRDFEHVARLVAPGQPMALYCLGEAWRKKGEPARARELWTEAQTTVRADALWQRRFAKFGVDLDGALAKL